MYNTFVFYITKLTFYYIYVIMLEGDKMFDKEKIIISEIRSVVFVKAQPPDKKQSRYGPRMPKYELVYKLSGECFTNFNGKRLHNLPDTIELLPKTENADYFVEYVEPGECIDIHFDTISPMPDCAMMIEIRDNKKLRSLFLKVYQLWTGRKDGYEYNCMSVFYDILSEIVSVGYYIPKEKYDSIKKGIDYLRLRCFDKDIDYYEPSRLCGISYTYFKRLFVKKFGMPPVKYVTKLRLEYACELIEAQRYSVGDIAVMCGFDNVYYFSKKFKEAYGVSPTNYKL